MAQRTQKTIAAHPGGILRTEFMEPMRIAAYQLAKALHLPGRNLRDRARTAGDHRGPRPAPLLRWLGWICADSRPPPRQILRDDAAVLDESSSRLRSAPCSMIRSRCEVVHVSHHG